MWPELDVPCEINDVRRNIEDGIAFGVFKDGDIVSAASAPAITHMQNLVEEPGVETAPRHRGSSYGKAVLSAMTQEVLGLGREPVYRTSVENSASVRLATSVGYKKIADSIEFIPQSRYAGPVESPQAAARAAIVRNTESLRGSMCKSLRRRERRRRPKCFSGSTTSS
jgi:hypothetical protein